MAWAEKLPTGKYRGLYRVADGGRRSTASEYSRRAQAERAAAQLEAEARTPGWRDPKLGQITWGEWFERWDRARVIENSTRSSEASMIRTHIMPFWKDRPLIDIRKHDVQVWVNDIAAENTAREGQPAKYRAGKTVRRILNVLVSSLSAAVDADLIGANPALRIKLAPLAPGRQVYLTQEQYHALVSAVPGETDRAVLDWLVGTGARWGEMAGQHTHNLNLRRGLVTIADVWDGTEIKPYPKGKRQRHVPVLPWVVERLQIVSAPSCGLRHKEGMCRSGLLFPAPRGGARDDRNFSQRVWAPAVKAAGLVDLNPTIHDLRHTYASWLIQGGVPIERVSQLLGHASITTTMIYAHLAPVQHDDVAFALPAPSGANLGQTLNLARVTMLNEKSRD
ncbi:tyrosine-type recombinase/integrase [Subtercola sp. YIM 133946]|uniref:tyrosine-type recombinase/integrase n=1 Tax=Subtercola sp. YIM 133946 TaxID=3118909 RepID=UPI002F92EA5A